MTQSNTGQTPSKPRFGCLHITGVVLFSIIASVLLTLWVAKNYLFVSQFTPVTLNVTEEQTLKAKLKELDITEIDKKTNNTEHSLKPEAYSEAGAKREINFTEKELNALLAKNTDLAHKMAIDLTDDLISIRLLVPIDEDFPVMGGKTLRLKAGTEFAYRDERPVVVLKGVSIMGVPVPNAWLGGIKNIDLVKEFGVDEGFWKNFSEGVANIQIRNGYLEIKLKE